MNDDEVVLQTTFGQAVRSVREKLGLTQEDLGRRVGLHRNYVGAVERGEINLTLKAIGKLARAAETEPSVVFELAEEKQRAVRVSLGTS